MSGPNLFNVANARGQHMTDSSIHNPSSHHANITLLPNRTYKARMIHVQSNASYHVPLQVHAKTILRLGEAFQSCDDTTFTYVHWNDRSAIATLTYHLVQGPDAGKAVDVYLYVNEYTND